MKLLYPICFLIFNLALAKNPAFILYDDGTWEKAGGASFDLSSSTSGNSSMGSLEVRAMLTMQSGDSKPVGNADVYLTTKSIAEIGRLMGRNPEYGFVSDWSSSMQFAIIEEYQGVGKGYLTGLNDSLIDSDITDLNGKVVLSGISPGKYYVNLQTALGGAGGCAWSVPVIVKAGRNKIILRNENVKEDLFHDGESHRAAPSPAPSTSPAPSPSMPNLTYESENPANESSLDDILDRELKEDPNTGLNPEFNEIESFEVAKDKIMQRYRNKEITLKEAGTLLTELKRKHNK